MTLLEHAETTELPRVFPPNLPPRLQALMNVHLRVTSARWKRRRRAPDGTWWSEGADGWLYRHRTELQIPVPPPGRTT